jgi:hypothetical protein
MKLRVQLQGVSVTGYRVKEDGEDKKKTKTKTKNIQMTQRAAQSNSLIGEL